jgi:hypothetical protein
MFLLKRNMKRHAQAGQWIQNQVRGEELQTREEPRRHTSVKSILNSFLLGTHNL